ncbi:MAG TPA: hypothetical protein VFI24_19900 [Pyrinomonadaceae bacterium]|nr:hypothetical protein [Pyrinomonadaceae bacterium]
MKRVFCIACTLAALMFLCSAVAFAQSTSPKNSNPSTIPGEGGKKNSDDDQTPLTTFEEEMKAKRAIKMAEKDHQENLDRAREIQQIGKQLKEALQGKSILERDDLKKVERLEKLTKKVRGEAGGEGEEITILNPPKDLPSVACQLAEKTEELSKEVQNTPRQVISASVISSANLLLELIRITRTFGSPKP